MDIGHLIDECVDPITLQRIFYYERFAWLSLSQDMVAVLSIDGQFEDVNSRWELTTGHRVEDLQTSYLMELIHFDDREMALANMQKLITSDIGSASVQFRILCKDGTYLSTLWNVIFSPDHSCYFCTVSDASELSRKRLESYAYKDALTGLDNRLSLEDSLPDSLDQAKASGSKVVIFFIDLDGFKEVNDTFGHKAGDTLLVRASQRMCKLMESLGRVYRLGGDEFVIVLPGGDDSTLAEALASDLVRRLSSRYLIEGERVVAGASVGIAEFPADACNLEGLLERADQAMYHVKRSGKNGYSFFSKIDS